MKSPIILSPVVLLLSAVALELKEVNENAERSVAQVPRSLFVDSTSMKNNFVKRTPSSFRNLAKDSAVRTFSNFRNRNLDALTSIRVLTSDSNVKDDLNQPSGSSKRKREQYEPDVDRAESHGNQFNSHRRPYGGQAAYYPSNTREPHLETSANPYEQFSSNTAHQGSSSYTSNFFQHLVKAKPLSILSSEVHTEYIPSCGSMLQTGEAKIDRVKSEDHGGGTSLVSTPLPPSTPHRRVADTLETQSLFSTKPENLGDSSKVKTKNYFKGKFGRIDSDSSQESSAYSISSDEVSEESPTNDIGYPHSATPHPTPQHKPRETFSFFPTHSDQPPCLDARVRESKPLNPFQSVSLRLSHETENSPTSPKMKASGSFGNSVHPQPGNDQQIIHIDRK